LRKPDAYFSLAQKSLAIIQVWLAEVNGAKNLRYHSGKKTVYFLLKKLAFLGASFYI